MKEHPIKYRHKNSEKLKAVDFFCSGGGMTYGMRKSGINIIDGIDIDVGCKETYQINNPGSKFIHADIFDLQEKSLERKINLKRNDDNLILVGCSPCQYWSMIRTEKTKAKKSKDLLKEFHRFVKYFNPGFVVVENVPGILYKKEESGLKEFIFNLKKRGYLVKHHVVNMNEYGVPQTRKRFFLVASRVTKEEVFPEPKEKYSPTVRDFIGEHNGFPRVEAGHKDETDFSHTVSKLSEKNLERIRRTLKDGGLPVWTKVKGLGRDKYKGNGFKDTYGRMAWDKPAPTITTKFYSLSNGRFGHPDENRAISIREGATLQTFPKDYVFYAKSIRAKARMIGNAVPPIYATRVGEAIIKSTVNHP